MNALHHRGGIFQVDLNDVPQQFFVIAEPLERVLHVERIAPARVAAASRWDGALHNLHARLLDESPARLFRGASPASKILRPRL